jgi:hypothetical protein
MITRAEVIAQIEACLTGTVSATALAAWAFDRFYELELHDESLEEASDVALAEALDDLMFADEQDFALSEADLRRLLTRLQEP